MPNSFMELTKRKAKLLSDADWISSRNCAAMCRLYPVTVEIARRVGQIVDL